MPLLLLVLLTRKLSVGYGRSLATLDSEAGGGKRSTFLRSRLPLSTRFARLLGGTQEGRASFDFVWQVATRDTQLKLGVYTVLFMIIGPLAGSFLRKVLGIWNQLRNS